ncbi:PAAR domain-containing protein [Nannocystis pusilla]|uniref:PAAR domain-containing protein n=1 Tax=Nannocystis pusilla TaxID=889268 RepID=UPI003DA644A4
MATPKAPPEPPKNPAAVLEEGIGKVMAKINAPVDAINERFAKWTAGLAQVWPEFPAATMGSLAVGLPHAHAPLPTLMPVIGAVALGCCVSVLINGLPAARVGDVGLNPTCLGAPLPGFEIFTGSSKVFIGGARAARQFERHDALLARADEGAEARQAGPGRLGCEQGDG